MIPIPIGDAPNFTARRPWVNWSLIAVNVTVFLWAAGTHSEGDAYHHWVMDWGFVPLAPRFETWFSSMFMHAGLGHLAGNMLFLWIFGDNVEGRLGHLGYLFAYLSFGLGAVLFFLLLDPNGAVPLVGASGAIFGVLGFYFLAFPRNRVQFFLWFFFVFAFWMPARIVLALYLGFDLLRLILDETRAGSGGSSGVAYAAHVGGFAFGVLMAAMLARLLPPLRPAPTHRKRRPGSAKVLFQNARYFQRRRQLRSARAAYQAILREHPESPQAPWAALYLGYLMQGLYEDHDAAAHHFEYAARHHPDPTVRAEAAQLAERARGLAAG